MGLAGSVCCINATVVCVNVLLFGPITADVLVRGPDRQPGAETVRRWSWWDITVRWQEPDIQGFNVSQDSVGGVVCVCH